MHKSFEPELLGDPQAALLKQRIEAKLKSGADVLKAPEEPETAEAASNVIDLMQVLKERLQGRQPQPARPKPAPSRGKPRGR
jgi:non-homologous end joining protein Ku